MTSQISHSDGQGGGFCNYPAIARLVLRDASALKLALASVLVLTHGLTMLEGVPDEATALVPVVPMFFFISGYYLYPKAGEQRIWSFWSSRYWRLFPVMIAAVVATIASAELGGVELPQSQWIIWIAAQLSIFQNYVPGGFGETAMPVQNGPVWFISAILIIISQKSGGNFEVAALTSLRDVLLVTFLSPAKLGWMAYVGFLLCKNLLLLLRQKVLVPLVALSLALTIIFEFVGIRVGLCAGFCPPWYYPAFVALWVMVSRRLPKMWRFPNISIEIYVWHAPVISFLWLAGLPRLWIAFPLVIVVSIVSCFAL